jgi:hypothetical protein
VLKDELDISYPVTKRAIVLLEREGSVLISEGKSGTRSAHTLTELAHETYPPPTSTDPPINRLATDYVPLQIGQTENRLAD